MGKAFHKEGAVMTEKAPLSMVTHKGREEETWNRASDADLRHGMESLDISQLYTDCLL